MQRPNPGGLLAAASGRWSMTAVFEATPSYELTAPPARFSGAAAARPRTLNDVLAATAARHPAAPAIDDGTVTLSYTALVGVVDELRQKLLAEGVGVGDRVGVRVPSGTVDLYVSILATLAAGAAYVPVDFEDPDERAELVFGEAQVSVVRGEGRSLALHGTPLGMPGEP